jgi:TRAP-type C4-dicarboxylate transport system permease small subunit
MNITDAIDVAVDLLPRRVKRLVGLLMLLLCLCFAATFVRLVDWYAEHKAREIVTQFNHVIQPLVPTTTGHP